jgi:hypothetical protein
MNAVRKALVFLFLVAVAFGQSPAYLNTVHNGELPVHVYIEPGISFSGSGYGTGALGTAGLDAELPRFIAVTSASYGTAGKTGNTTPISAGHTRSASTSVFYKFRNGWYAGAGAGFGETLTALYDKYSWHPQVGGGHDFINKDSSWRLQMMYLHNLNEFTRYPTAQMDLTPPPGYSGVYTPTTCKCNNGVQGIDVNAWMPSPATNHHFFLHADIEPIWFHETVTDPYSTQAWVRAQRDTREYGSSISAGFVVRW